MEIAEIFGLTPPHVTRIVNAPCFLDEVERLRNQVDDQIMADIREDIRKLGPRAVEVLDEQLNWPGMDEKIKQKAAFGVLEMLGHKKKDGPKGGSKSLTLVKIDKIVNNANREDLQDDVLELVNMEEVLDGQE